MTQYNISQKLTRAVNLLEKLIYIMTQAAPIYIIKKCFGCFGTFQAKLHSVICRFGCTTLVNCIGHSIQCQPILILQLGNSRYDITKFGA